MATVKEIVGPSPHGTRTPSHHQQCGNTSQSPDAIVSEIRPKWRNPSFRCVHCGSLSEVARSPDNRSDGLHCACCGRWQPLTRMQFMAIWGNGKCDRVSDYVAALIRWRDTMRKAGIT